MLRIERNFFGNLRKNVFGCPRRAAANLFGAAARRRRKLTGAPPETDRRVVDTMTALVSTCTKYQTYVCYINVTWILGTKVLG